MEFIKIDLNGENGKNPFWWIFDGFYRIFKKTDNRTFSTWEAQKKALTSKSDLEPPLKLKNNRFKFIKNRFELKKMSFKKILNRFQMDSNRFLSIFSIKIDAIPTRVFSFGEGELLTTISTIKDWNFDLLSGKLLKHFSLL